LLEVALCHAYEVIPVKAACDAVGRHMAAAMNALLHRTARMRRSRDFSA
jgi:hypothetical protein